MIHIKPLKVFKPLWVNHARHKGAFGGRGSGKSRDRAMASVVELLKGRNVVGVREVQRSIKNSVYSLVCSVIDDHGLSGQFGVMRDEIRCDATGARMIFRGMQDHTASSIKSLEGFDVAWVEEAQTISQRSIELLVPTIRTQGSEIWWTWNPEYDHDPVDKLLRGDNAVDDAVIVQANWTDNPFFPDDLKADKQRDHDTDIALYEHIWEGAYRSNAATAFYGEQLTKARLEQRICSLPIETNPPIITAWDIGITVTAIWAAQKVGREVRIIDYMEDTGKDAAYYAKWVRDRGYDTGPALLPHDADIRDRTAKSYVQHLEEAGLWNVIVLPRTNDVLGDIQTVRTFLALCWIDETRCKDGLKALGAYHWDWDDRLGTPKKRPVGDWASHGADSLRYLAQGFDDAVAMSGTPAQEYDDSEYHNAGAMQGHGWMVG